MKCTECGSKLVSSIENYKYLECGLPYVTLCDVTVRRCEKCGSVEVAISNIEGLHRSIALTLIQKPTRFTGEEIKFLRKSIGLSARLLADRMGIDPATLSRWENGHDEIGVPCDRLLRLLVANEKPVEHYPAETLSEIEPAAKPFRVGMRARQKVWEAQPVSAC